MNLSLISQDFFYNIFPGAYFILLLRSPNILSFVFDDQNKSSIYATQNVAFFITFSLIFGFTFQFLTTIMKSFLPLDDLILCSVIEKNKDIFDQILKEFQNQNIIQNPKDLSRLDIFYLAENYLSVNHALQLPYYFGYKSSLWSNFFWANVLLILVNRFNSYNYIFFLLTIISLIAFVKYKRAQFDATLKSFIVYKKSSENLKKS